MTMDTAIIIVIGLGVIVVLLMTIITIQKWINFRVVHKKGLARDYLVRKYFDFEDIRKPLSNRFFFDAYIDIETHIEIEPKIRQRVIDDLKNMRFAKSQIRKLNHISSIKRRIAIFYISTLRTAESYQLLKNRLSKEKNYSVLFYLINALKNDIDFETFDQVIQTLIDAPECYKKWISALLTNHYAKIKDYIPHYFDDQRLEVKKLLITFAGHFIDEHLKDYATRIFHESILEQELQMLAIESLAKMHPQSIANDWFCKNSDDAIKRVAIKAASSIVSQDMVHHLLSSMNGSSLDLDRVNALSRIVFDSKTLLLHVLEYYGKTKIDVQKTAIVRVLSHRIDYLMLKINTKGYEFIKEMIEHMLELHIIEDFIDFMNLNRNQEIEQNLVSLIRKHAAKDKYLLEQFTIYLNQDILNKLGLIKISQPISNREKSPLEKSKIVWITSWVIVAILFFPLLFFITRFRAIFDGTTNVFEYFIVSINTYLVIYFLSINTVYLLLLLLSVKGSKERIDLWQIKKHTLLFERNILPSISIIAPAYNEEKNIIESVTSLLNLKYPKYEVIVINDGSKDQTINVLIDHFKLERKHPFFKMSLKTQTLRGVYVTKHIPNLIVIDKQNGGKADALNMGINVAKSDYICGIDADSLLEEDALLRLMSVTLDHTTDFIALGGNIVPVNGCVVDKGKIEESGLARKPLARFQTLEYLRAFTTGRIGWSKLKSLLIISGAFGLFQRKSLITTGGYLTISGNLKKDTVGEDMELVVRLTHEALVHHKPYRVEYVHHANCYTELPNDLHSLLKQRNRWQRGLLDILSYHRKLLFNPKYKQPGLIGFPYFFIFEMLGPFFEIIGYIALIIGFSLGILNLEFVLVLLVATIGYGIVISLFSLWIAERRNQFYSNKETLILIIIAIIENFGYRQMMSLHRIFSTFSALRESGSWGSQKRQGFQKK